MDQKNKQRKDGRSEEKELLKEYLSQYRYGRMKRQQLERRLKNIRAAATLVVVILHAEPFVAYQPRPLHAGGASAAVRHLPLLTARNRR